MKTVFAIAILTVLASLPLVAQTQDKQHVMDHPKHMQMMKDSSMMDMMMSHIATDPQTRIRMKEKMAEYVEGDTASMRELCAVMLKDTGEQSANQGSGCCKGKGDTLQGTTGEPEKVQHKRRSHEKSPKH